MRVLAVLLLFALPAVAAPRLKDRPLDLYERQITPGFEVNLGEGSRVVITKVFLDNGMLMCKFRFHHTQDEYKYPVWVSDVARWMREYPQGRRGK